MTQSTMTPQSAPPSWRERRPILTWLRKRYTKWRSRHQLPFNFGIHLVGIPLTLAGIVLLCCAEWLWGIGVFVLGYVFQYIGHKVEGNDVGEWAAIKRLLGLPYVAVSPRWQNQEPSKNGDS